MTSKVIPHIFGSLLALERGVALLHSRKVQLDELGEIIPEMRKAANLIQLQFARKDTLAAQRSLQIFYGLLSMVRPLVIDALKKQAQLPVSKPAGEKQKAAMH